MATLLEAKSNFQHIKITSDLMHEGELVLYLDTLWQFSTFTEWKYHESLITIPMCAAPQIDRVLICGGGDGMALREALRFGCLPTLVELDPGMITVFRDIPEYAKYNRDSMKNPRAKIVTGDAIKFLENSQEQYHMIVWDFPSPGDDNFNGALKLYSAANIRKAIKCLYNSGVFVAQVSIETSALAPLVKEFFNQGFKCWHYDAYYDQSGNHDSFLVASRNQLRMERKPPKDSRYANEDRVRIAFSKATEIVKEDIEYYIHFAHLEQIEQDNG